MGNGLQLNEANKRQWQLIEKALSLLFSFRGKTLNFLGHPVKKKSLCKAHLNENGIIIKILYHYIYHYIVSFNGFNGFNFIKKKKERKKVHTDGTDN